MSINTQSLGVEEGAHCPMRPRVPINYSSTLLLQESLHASQHDPPSPNSPVPRLLVSLPLTNTSTKHCMGHLSPLKVLSFLSSSSQPSALPLCRAWSRPPQLTDNLPKYQRKPHRIILRGTAWFAKQGVVNLGCASKSRDGDDHN